jgi:hypothetical protein
MAQASYKEFRQYLAGLTLEQRFLRRAHFAMKHKLFHVRPWLPWRAKNVLRRYGLDLLRAGIVQDARYEFPITEHDYTFHWAVGLLSRRYQPGDGLKS